MSRRDYELVADVFRRTRRAARETEEGGNLWLMIRRELLFEMAEAYPNFDAERFREWTAK
jgi:hypothetical protein